MTRGFPSLLPRLRRGRPVPTGHRSGLAAPRAPRPSARGAHAGVRFRRASTRSAPSASFSLSSTAAVLSASIRPDISSIRSAGTRPIWFKSVRASASSIAAAASRNCSSPGWQGNGKFLVTDGNRLFRHPALLCSSAASTHPRHLPFRPVPTPARRAALPVLPPATD